MNDSTPEKLGELLAARQKGLMFFRDELAGWFGSFDKYSGSGAERALWLEAYPQESCCDLQLLDQRCVVILHVADPRPDHVRFHAHAGQGRVNGIAGD